MSAVPDQLKNELTQLRFLVQRLELKTKPSWPYFRDRIVHNRLLAKFGRVSNRVTRMAIQFYRDERSRVETENFYDTEEWRRVRYSVILRDGSKCAACGATQGQMHVDHIKPRSKFPELELDPRNLQVLCKDCNMGKSNWDQTDWRRK